MICGAHNRIYFLNLTFAVKMSANSISFIHNTKERCYPRLNIIHPLTPSLLHNGFRNDFHNNVDDLFR